MVNWIPAKKDGKNVDSKMYFLFHIYNSTVSTKFAEKPYLIPIELGYFGVPGRVRIN